MALRSRTEKSELDSDAGSPMLQIRERSACSRDSTKVRGRLTEHGPEAGPGSTQAARPLVGIVPMPIRASRVSYYRPAADYGIEKLAAT